MKYNYSVIFFACFFLSPYFLFSMVPEDTIVNQRNIFSINEQWRFFYTEIDCEYPTLSPTDWEQINLPHTWNNVSPLSDTAEYLRGTGWYEKRISLPDNFHEKQIFLHFEGANQVAEIFINGKLAGKHIGGYTAFSIDITSFVNHDREGNTILVKVDNQFNKNIPPLSADFTFYGGIYRDVWIIATEKVHFSLNEYGSKGLYISTPQVDSGQAVVQIEGKIESHINVNEELIIVNTIYDSEDKIIAEGKIRVNSKATGPTNFKADEIIVIEPKLWSPDHPNLYTVKSEIFVSGNLTDIIFNPLGFRWYRISADSGFFLNGKSLRLIGTNRHQDYEGLGNALDNQLHIKDMEMVKAAGFNFLRLAHYPQDPAVLEAADRLGLIIWEEIPIVNYISTSNEFRENSIHMLQEMIHQHFNHPSIILWGYMNEVFLYDADGNRSQEMNFPEEYLESVLLLAKILDSIAHREDPGRITAIAAHSSDIYDKTRISGVPDALGFNLYQGWYSSNPEDFGKYLDKMHLDYPDRKIIVSEYGAGSDERIHMEKPQVFDFSTEYQQLYHESYLRQIIDRPYLLATAAWAQNDFGSNSRGDSKPKINQKGLQYFNRQPKDIYYLYQSRLSKNPTVHIASHDWKSRYSSSDKVSLPLKVYTNLKELDIYVDHHLIGSFEIDNSCILNLDVNLSIGKHFIESKGKFSNSVYSDHLELHILDDYDPFRTQIEILVNVGSAGQYRDQSGCIWRKDREYSENGFGYTGGDPRPLYGSKGVLGTENDPIFQTYRQGLTSYRFDAPSGIYEVELCFAEMEHQKPDERVMDISINGSLIWNNLDLVKEYGYLQAVSRKFEFYINDQENLEINIEAKKGMSLLNGIRIRKK